MSKNEMIMLPREVAEQALEALLNEGEFRKLLEPLIEKSIDSIRDALEQPDAGPTATTPEGWKLVPVEPTIAMLCDAVMEWEGQAVYKVMSASGLRKLEEQAADGYRAMLAAAPQPTERYGQQALDLCLTCGWKTMIPGDCRLNCARQKPQVGDQPPKLYPLPADLYDSKDWRSGTYAERVEWLHTMYESAKEQIAELERPRPDATPYLWYDPENGDTWTQEAVDEGFCATDGLIPLYTK